MDPPPQDLIHEQAHHLEGELHEQISEEENMDETVDMDTKSMGFILKEFDRGQRELVERCESEILVAIRGLGGSRKAHKRERNVALNRIVSKVYSPPRVAAAAKLLPSHGILPGASLDLTVIQGDATPWDIDIKANRGKGRALHELQQPALLVGSVVCTAFSQIQTINTSRREILRLLHGREYEPWYTSGLCVSCTKCKCMRADTFSMNILQEPRHGKRSALREYGGSLQWKGS